MRPVSQDPGPELERALAIVAYVVVRHGDAYGPLLDRVEQELNEVRRKAAHRDRAQRILSTMMREAKGVSAA